jgi:hypothetical protein
MGSSDGFDLKKSYGEKDDEKPKVEENDNEKKELKESIHSESVDK